MDFRRLWWFLFMMWAAVVAMAWSNASHAQPVDVWYFQHGTCSGGYCTGSSGVAAIQSFATQWKANNPNDLCTYVNVRNYGAMVGQGSGSGTQPVAYDRLYDGMGCAATTFTFTTSKSCSSPNVLNSSGACVVPGAAWPEGSQASCTAYAGTEFSLLSVSGWDTTPNPMEGSSVAIQRAPVDVVQSGCKAIWIGADYVEEGSTQVKCTTADSPGSTGLYPTRCYNRYRYTGAVGTSEITSAENYDPPPPACPGALGTVNGDTRCLPVAGTSAPSTAVAPKVNADSSTSPRSTVEEVHTPGAADGGRQHTHPGTPGAQSAPNVASGPGQGRGGVEGAGTSVAASPGGGTVNVDVRMCGSAGQPPCKIDEGGTPTDGALTSQRTEFDAALTARQSTIEQTATSGKKQDADLGISWTIPTPTGDCVNPSLTIPHGWGTLAPDLCGGAEVFRVVLGWLFAVLTALYIWRASTNAIGG